jgi:predicted metal-binding transcription factor (methanogenesis marker protein 9)
MQESNHKPYDRADSPHCVCRHGATVCMHFCGQVLRACQPVLLPLKHLAHRPSSYSKHCDDEAACGQCLSGFLGL